MALKDQFFFLHVTGEEHGLLGSQYYSENPLFAYTITDINIDMIGRRDKEHAATNNYVYLSGLIVCHLILILFALKRMTNTYKWNWI
jgi:hypothetical protein